MESVPAEQLAAMMRSARRRTLALLEGLSAEQLVGPRLPTVNPLLWEAGHVAWFFEQFILRREYGLAPLLERGDELYDSIAIPHEARWDLPLLPQDELLDYMRRVHEALLERLGSGDVDARRSYLHRLASFHEDMHTEAFLWMRQVLAYPTPTLPPDEPRPEHAPARGELPGDAQVPGGAFELGASPGAPFLFDNEKWAHPVTVAPFRMARAPVTQEEFASFVEDGGYRTEALWSEAGWRWRAAAGAEHPVYWTRSDGGWRVRRFDRLLPLAPHEPVVHVNWYEAQAFCRWAGRRLPTEAEWEFAATLRPGARGALVKARFPWGDDAPAAAHANLDGFTLGCVDVAAYPSGDGTWGHRQMIGNVWEWTAETFAPFPGFAPDDYREYSEPLFRTTKVLRGGCWATRGRMISGTYRNFFETDRRDVFAGFRTCAR